MAHRLLLSRGCCGLLANIAGHYLMAGATDRALFDEPTLIMLDDPRMERHPHRRPRYPSVILIIGSLCAIVGLTTGTIDRDWRSTALGLAVLILAALTYASARRRQGKISDF